MSHPPFAHNPHVYGGVDPNAPVAEPIVVHSPAQVPEPGPELVDVPPGATGDTSNEDANVDVNGDGQVDGYEVFTKAELVAECEARGLPTTGNKPDLVARLQDADKAAVPAQAEPGE